MTKPKGLVKVYAVRRGRNVGLYDSYEDVVQQVHGFQGAEQKSFPTIAEARQWLQDGGVMLMADGSFIQTGSSMIKLPQTAVRRNSAASGLGSGSEMDFDEEDSEAPQDCEEESPSQAQPWNGPEALGRAVLLIEGLKANITVDSGSIYYLNFNGAIRSNPGWAGCSAVISDPDDHAIAELCASLPFGTTSGEAEYGGVVLGLHAALNLGIKRLDIRGDSQLVVRQLQGSYQVRNERLQPLSAAAMQVIRSLDECSLTYVTRELNKRAGLLANHAVDVQIKA